MSLVKVARYYGSWDKEKNIGKIVLYDKGSNKLFDREYNNPEEFQEILGKLRSEKPLWFGRNSIKLKKGTLIQDESVVDQVK